MIIKVERPMTESDHLSMTCVIPAAGRDTYLLPIGVNTPAPLIPIAGQPLISITINHLNRVCRIGRFVIVVSHDGDRIEDYLNRTYRNRANSKLSITILRQEILDGPLGAIRIAQKEVGDTPQLIVLGDTLVFDPLKFDTDFVLVHSVSDYSRWCLATTDVNGNLGKLYDKWDAPPPVVERHALVGVYYLSNTKIWKHCIEQVYDANEQRGNRTEGVEFQLSSALERYHQQQPIAVREAKEWFDCGNIDQYLRTRRKLLQSRSDNNLHVSPMGVLHKNGKNSEVLQAEIKWYRALPSQVQPLVPRVFSSSCRPEATYIDLEYIPVPTLAEYYLYANVSPDMWDYAITKILDLWHQYFYNWYERGDQLRKGQAPYRKTLEMYWDKTQARLHIPEIQWIIDTKVNTLNGRRLRAWQDLEQETYQQVQFIAKRCHWSLMHGDFHFGNIFFDFGSGQLKLIDPRGEFGKSGERDSIGCYGDAHYDLAKFLHSFHGGYAHLSANMFELSRDGDDFTVVLHGGTDRERLLEVFAQWLTSKKLRIDLNELMLLEGLLFITMLKFHKDNKERQLAEYLIGLNLLTSSLEALNRTDQRIV
jgi:NDP-sugar pyrophosphorylase family protein